MLAYGKKAKQRKLILDITGALVILLSFAGMGSLLYFASYNDARMAFTSAGSCVFAALAVFLIGWIIAENK